MAICLRGLRDLSSLAPGQSACLWGGGAQRGGCGVRGLPRPRRGHGLHLPFLPQLWGPAALLPSGLSRALRRGPRSGGQQRGAPGRARLRCAQGSVLHCSSLLGPGHSPGGGAAPSLRLPEAGGPAGRSGLGVEASGPELGDPEPPGEGAAPSTAGWGRSSPMGQLRGPKAVPGDRAQSGHWTLGHLHQCAGGRVCVGVGLCPCVLGRGKLSCVCRITCGGRGQEPSVTIGRERD